MPSTSNTPEPRKNKAPAPSSGHVTPHGSEKPKAASAKKTAPDGKTIKKHASLIIRRGWITLGLILVALAAIPVIWFKGLGVLAVAETLLRDKFYLLALVALPVVIALLCWGRSEALKDGLRPSERQAHPVAKKLTEWGTIATLVALVGGAYAFAVHPYVVAKSYTTDTTTVNEQTSYADRAPWVVANNYAQRDQGDVIGDRGSVHYVPAPQDAQAKAGDGAGEGTSRYTVLVKERGVLGTGGYAAVQTLTMPTTGTIPGNASDFCKIPDGMSKRLETIWPWHALSWSIHAKAPFAHWDNDDAYGYCADGKPQVIVPLFKYSGFWNVTKVPNGAAIYDESGVRVLSAEELAQANIEGPTYPRTIAAAQRSAINAGGSLMEWWGSKYGYDLTDDDEEDANGENSSEFTLVRPENHELSYVTPLTPRGSSQSITAISAVPAVQQGAGRAKLVINTATDLPATSTLVTAIKESSVKGDNAWTTRWSAGMGVYEILPARDGHWAASIGQGQAVSYRADIAPDGKVTVVNAETGQSSDRGKASNDSVTVKSEKPLNEMSEKELLDLIQQATGELQKRQSANP